MKTIDTILSDFKIALFDFVMIESSIISTRHADIFLADLRISFEERDRELKANYHAELCRVIEGEKLPKVNEHGSKTFFVGGGAQMRMEAYNNALDRIKTLSAEIASK